MKDSATNLAILLNRKLVDWLIDHIGRSGSKFGVFVKVGVNYQKYLQGNFFTGFSHTMYTVYSRNTWYKELDDDTTTI